MAYVSTMTCTEKKLSLSQIAQQVEKSLAQASIVSKTTLMENNVVVLCFEQYFMRVESSVALTVVLVERPNAQQAILTGFAGGQGLFNFSFRANKAFVERAQVILQPLGFVVDQQDATSN